MRLRIPEAIADFFGDTDNWLFPVAWLLLGSILLGGLVHMSLVEEAANQRDCLKRNGRWVVVRQDDVVSTVMVGNIPVNTISKVDVYGCTK